jgi:molybdopterin molybdotransferase
MLDVDSALQRVLAVFSALPTEVARLLDADGRVLAADVVAEDNVPPFRNSAMDGYAVRTEDVASATWDQPAVLPVVDQVAAGAPGAMPLGKGQAIRIMTGAPLPAGADAVVRFEETDEAQGRIADSSTVRIFRPPKILDNVREAGEDIARGSVIARRGQALAPPLLGLLASVGLDALPVHRRPVVGILSTGNEVVPPGQQLPLGKIRDSNAYVLGALARGWGADVRMLGIAQDTLEALRDRLHAAAGYDLIVTSGGVSLGDFDFVKDVLRAEGSVDIWQVRMKPGKPLAFGRIADTPLLGLPGNPVAAAVSFLLFGRPTIRTMLGHADISPTTIDVIAGEEIDNRGHRRHFVRARIEPRQDGPAIALSVGEQGAGVLSSLAAANALLIVPEDVERVVPGMALKAIQLPW